MEILGYVSLAIVLALVFEIRFKKSFFPALLLGIVLTPLVSGLLLTTSLRALSKIKDSWVAPTYRVPTYTAQLPRFSKPEIEQAPEETSLQSRLSSQEAMAQDSINSYAREKHMRRLLQNDKRAFNRELFAFAQKKEAQLNTFIEREIFYYLEAGIIANTLNKDDFIDLEAQRVDPDSFSFQSPDMEPIPAPETPSVREEPTYSNTALPKLARLMPPFLRTPIHDALLEKNLRIWNQENLLREERSKQLSEDYYSAEKARVERLTAQRKEYEQALEEFKREARAHNSELDMVIQGFEAGERGSVQDYVVKVLNGSSYPAEVQSTYEVEFNENSHELLIRVNLPEAKSIEPLAVKYKLVKSRASVEESPVSKTEFKRLYNLLVMQLLIRYAHEVSEADRMGTIKSLNIVGLIPDNISGSLVPVALLAGRSEEFVGQNLRGEVSALFRSLGGVISKDAMGASPVAVKGSIRGK